MRIKKASVHTVLIVEDEDFLADAYRTILEANSYKVEVIADGLEVLSAVRQIAPDLILLDMRLPGMDGIGVLEAMRKDDMTTPVIVLSNHSVRSEIDAAYALGAVRYIVKSWTSPRELVGIVSDTLAR